MSSCWFENSLYDRVSQGSKTGTNRFGQSSAFLSPPPTEISKEQGIGYARGKGKSKWIQVSAASLSWHEGATEVQRSMHPSQHGGRKLQGQRSSQYRPTAV